jgi:hypothetical protein
MARVPVNLLQAEDGSYALVEGFRSRLASRQLELTVMRLQPECPGPLREYEGDDQGVGDLRDPHARRRGYSRAIPPTRGGFSESLGIKA